ncbi:hypothetical protein OEZ86_003016 [Tetradesmus obliquus]|nr:hypothetical protein OEZ86_003016 [Tetradesmus obliquus]
MHTAAPITTISSSSTQGSPNTAPPAAVEIPPIAPSVPAPSTPPNSPLPTPHVPNPPFLATPPPPSIPPQLLPPCPGDQPPPQKLIPNAPAADKAPVRPASCDSSSCSSSGPAAETLEDVLAGSSSSSSNGGLLGLFRQQQALQHRWQQALLHAAFADEAFVRVGLIVLRLLVQITAVLLQAAVKLLVWLLDWAGQRTADRVAAVRQQNVAQLGVAAVVQQQGSGQHQVMGMQVALAAAAEQQAPDLAAPVV